MLRRPKFQTIEPGKIDNFLSLLQKSAKQVSPQKKITIIKSDPADNKFLECALESKADFLITGNTKHFSFKSFHHTRIVNPDEFVSIISEALFK